MAGLKRAQPRICSVETTYTDNEDGLCWQKNLIIDPWHDPDFFIEKVSSTSEWQWREEHSKRRVRKKKSSSVLYKPPCPMSMSINIHASKCAVLCCALLSTRASNFGFALPRDTTGNVTKIINRIKMSLR